MSFDISKFPLSITHHLKQAGIDTVNAVNTARDNVEDAIGSGVKRAAAEVQLFSKDEPKVNSSEGTKWWTNKGDVLKTTPKVGQEVWGKFDEKLQTSSYKVTSVNKDGSFETTPMQKTLTKASGKTK